MDLLGLTRGSATRIAATCRNPVPATENNARGFRPANQLVGLKRAMIWRDWPKMGSFAR